MTSNPLAAPTNAHSTFQRAFLPWTLALSLWAAHPFLQMNFLVLTQQLNWYPPQTDSIGIPIMGGFMMAVFGAPFWVWYCHSRFKHLRRQGSCFAANPATWRQPPVCCGVLGLFILLSLWSIVSDIQLYWELIHSSHASYAYFAISEAASSLGLALLWWILLNCPRADESLITDWSEGIKM